ncbi:MAG: SLBB domain-containing protein [Armatimonadota bacterium]
MKTVRFLLGALCAVIACFSLPASAQTSSDPVIIGTRDQIQVTILGTDEEMGGKQQVDDAGNIKLPLINVVNVLGLSEQEAANKITALLKKYYIDPQVTIVIIERAERFVTVMGAVKKPGKTPLRPDVPAYLLEVVQAAEPLDNADLTRVLLRKAGATTETSVNLEEMLKKADPAAREEVKPGDLVTVSAKQTMSVFVVGAVVKAGAYELQTGGNLREALAAAGGISVEADTNRISIRSEGNAQEAVVSYADAMSSDPAKQVTLKPNDRILVPLIQDPTYFSVMGGVAKPGTLPLMGRMRLSEAISAAGGFKIETAKKRDIKVLRQVKGSEKPTLIKVDFTKLEKGEADDILIEANDKIVVGESRGPSAAWQPIGTVLSALLSIVYLGDRIK